MLDFSVEMSDNERDRNGACNTIPAPHTRPSLERQSAMPHYKAVPTLTPKQIERFWSKVDTSAGLDGCWLWTGYIQPAGYGQCGLFNSLYLAHRVAWTLANGAIPDGMSIDHVRKRGCTNKNCVNPSHLEPVTQRENVLRGTSLFAVQARQTHCLRGHELVGDNLSPYELCNGRRICLECCRIRDRNRRRAKSAAKRQAVQS